MYRAYNRYTHTGICRHTHTRAHTPHTRQSTHTIIWPLPRPTNTLWLPSSKLCLIRAEVAAVRRTGRGGGGRRIERSIDTFRVSNKCVSYAHNVTNLKAKGELTIIFKETWGSNFAIKLKLRVFVEQCCFKLGSNLFYVVVSNFT